MTDDHVNVTCLYTSLYVMFRLSSLGKLSGSHTGQETSDQPVSEAFYLWICDLYCLGTDVASVFFYFRARRAAKEAKESPAQPAPEKVKVEVRKFVKIGRPGYKGMRTWVHYYTHTLM